MIHLDCVKNVRIRSYSGPHFPAFGLITERYGVSLRMQSKYVKMRTRITPNKDTFHAVLCSNTMPVRFESFPLINLKTMHLKIKVSEEFSVENLEISLEMNEHWTHIPYTGNYRIMKLTDMPFFHVNLLPVSIFNNFSLFPLYENTFF